MFTLNQPLDVPWKLIGASPDMMDVRAGNHRYPFRWRSSIAIYAFEPRLTDLPEELCDERITLVKVSCSITGYQPSQEEIASNRAAGAGTRPVEEATRLVQDYFGCYGVQLNVAIFPPEGTELASYPHIVDFEPKLRDLYQLVTEDGELLSASRADVNTDKSFTNTKSTETGLALQAKAKYGGFEATGTLSHKWGQTEQDAFQVQADASLENRERHSTSTQLNQMYNLLTGYHAGTNRALFMMLPRPHVLEPTIKRTFVQGLRAIEGMQDFFLVVLRKKDQPRFSVEVTLETGHFPDRVDVETPTPESTDELSQEEFEVRVTQGYGIGAQTQIDSHPTAIFTLDGEWRVDRSRGDSRHPGIDEIDNLSSAWNGKLSGYTFRAISDKAVQVYGRLDGPTWAWDAPTEFRRVFRVYKRRSRTQALDQSARVTTPFLVTSRSLFVHAMSGERCVEIDALPTFTATSVVDEQILQMSGQLQPRDAVARLRHVMVGSANSPLRRQSGTAGILSSDYARDRLRKNLPPELLKQAAAGLDTIPEDLRKHLDPSSTVQQVLDTDIGQLAAGTGLTLEQAAQVRERVLAHAATSGSKKQE